MGNGTFYTPSGTSTICKDCFIKLYSESYYLNNTRIVSGVKQSSSYIENRIDNLLAVGIKNEADVARILAWKIGKINHKESEKQKEFKYALDWDNIENSLTAPLYDYTLDFSDFAHNIVKNIDYLETLATLSPCAVLNELIKYAPPKGIGIVYLITIMYFISKRTHPIYDRYAMMAVDAIFYNIAPHKHIEYQELPDINSNKLAEAIEIYEQYIKKLDKIFGNEFKENRNIDRALWVYGHSFKSKKSKC